MHILDKEFRKELIDIYTGKKPVCLKIEKITTYIFNRVFYYLVEHRSVTDGVDEIRKLIDALADWTHNPTESELREILDVKEKVSGYIIKPSFATAIRVIMFCTTRGIPFSAEVGTNNEYQKVSFKDITVNQYETIVKNTGVSFLTTKLYPKENGKENNI